MERKLVTIRKICGVEPIPGADAIEVATVDGWKVVVRKGEFKLGEWAVYCEVDSWIPHELAPFLSKGQEPREYEGVKGEKLRTVKLRGQVSQGLLLPIHSCWTTRTLDRRKCPWDYQGKWEDGEVVDIKVNGEWTEGTVEGLDLTEYFGVKKWEPPVPASLAGLVKGPFPSFIRKTDQERAQNLGNEIFGVPDSRYEVTVKLDGSSFTAYHYNGELGVCSRNLELKLSEENKDNTLVKVFYQCGLHLDLPKLGNIAVQAELMGEGIQGNREGIKGHTIFVFDVFDIDQQRYLTPVERADVMSQLSNKVNHVPIVLFDRTLEDVCIGNMDELLKFADGPSIHHPVREGLVWKSMDGTFSFKTISNQFLLKEKD